jgi:short subunit fatty acids transporter
MLKKIALLIVLVLMTSCTSSTKPNAEEITSVDQVYLDSPTNFRIVKGNIERRAKSGSFFSSDSRVEKP